jgi:hypothetical protein
VLDALIRPQDPFAADIAADVLARGLALDAPHALREMVRKWQTRPFASVATLRRHMMRLVREFGRIAPDSGLRQQAVQLLLMIAYWAQQLYALEETMPADAQGRNENPDRRAHRDIIACLWASLEQCSVRGMRVGSSELVHATDALVIYELSRAAKREGCATAGW